MKRTTLLLALAIFIGACQKNNPIETSPNNYNIIPQPAQLKIKKGNFKITSDTKIWLASEDEGLKLAAESLQSLLGPVEIEKEEKGKDVIIFSIDPSLENDEAYQLNIDPYEVNIKAKTGAGAFYAVQTLFALSNFKLGSGSSKDSFLGFPCVEINDAPRYPYRGIHLDVSRHFFPVDFIKKFIDLMALYKMNKFHWHLTDDQGWRLEIKKYPKLQEVGACRDETLVGHYNDQPHQFDGKKYCGYYTQEEAREVVNYAAERFITVIPEIEMPGHAMAAIAAYPELGCTGQPTKPAMIWGIHDNVFCPNEATFEFLENVLIEVMEIFPSKYIHVGGDECPKTKWKESRFCQDLIKKEGLKDEHSLQSYFIRRIEKFLNAKGRSIIGWDEILEGGLAPNATVMSWTGIEGGIAAAKMGHDVIMSPTSHCYFDYYQSESPDEPLAIGGYLPLETVYSYEPTPAELSAEEAKYITGVQGNTWTEYLNSPEKVEYMVFPRACAIAEIGWSPKEARNYGDFVERLKGYIKYMESSGVNTANKIYDVKASIKSGDGKGVRVSLRPNMEGVDVRYSLDGNEPRATSSIYSKAIEIKESGMLKAHSFEGEKAVGIGAALSFQAHKASGKHILLTNMPVTKYSGNGPGSIVNGVTGSNERYGGAEWLGFDGKDFEAEIDLGEELEVSKVSTRFFNGKGQWIYPPKSMTISISSDGESFKDIGQSKVEDGEGKIIFASAVFEKTKGRFLKIHVKRFGIIPAGQQGAGHEAWLFVDEVVVE